MTPADLAAIRAAAEAATPGEWETDQGQSWAIYQTEDNNYLRRVAECSTLYGRQAIQDAAYIAKANPAVMLRLLDRIEALERAVTVRWEGRNAYLGNQQIGCTTVLLSNPVQYAASSRLFSHTLMPYPTEAEARAALGTAVREALGLAEKGDNNARQRN